MKKSSLMIIALLALAACAKELPNINLLEKEDVQFTAETIVTKTSLGEENAVLWTEGDAISVFSQSAPDQNERFTSSAINGNSAKFSGKAVAGDKYYAAYPYRQANKMIGTTLSLTIPAQQTLLNGSFANETNPSVAIAAGSTLQFHNVAALVSFRVPALNGAAVVKAVFKGNAGEKVAGAVSVDMNQELKKAVPAETAQTEATLTGKFVEGETYYIAVAPGKFTKGIKVSLFDDAGKSYSIKGDAELTLTAGKILPLAGFQFVPDVRPTEFYVKVDGKGDGSSWAEAASLTNALAWAKDGNTIHVAAGKYLPAASATGYDAFTISSNVKVIGGYPSDAAEGAVVDAANKTIVSGNNKQNCLLVKAPKTEALKVEFTGFTFTEGKSSGAHAERTVNGAVIRKGRGGCLVVANSRALFRDCVISGNIGYSAPALYNVDGAETTFETCKVNGNEGSGNGCGVWNSFATFKAMNCEFIGNKGTGEGVAGPVYAHGETEATSVKTSTYIYNCLFKDNEVGLGKKQGSKRGGAIYAREGCNTIILNTTFYANNGGNGSAVSAYGTAAKKSEFTMIGCTITGNHSYHYGALDFWDPGITSERCVNSRIYNTIISGNTDVKGNPDVNVTNKYNPVAGKLPAVFASCIDGKDVYDNTGALIEGQAFDFTTMLSPYLNGVCRLQGTDNPAVTAGMSTADLADIDLSMFPDFEASYLEIDQNGKPRTGNHMGACAE